MVFLCFFSETCRIYFHNFNFLHFLNEGYRQRNTPRPYRNAFYAVRLYSVCVRPFWHSQQERSVFTAAVQPAPDGLYQVGMSITAYCLSIILCFGVILLLKGPDASSTWCLVRQSKSRYACF